MGDEQPRAGEYYTGKDIRKGYEFSLEFTPDSGHSLSKWMAYPSAALNSLPGDWLDDPSLIAKGKLEELGPSEVILPSPNASGGIFNFTILTAKPVTLVPWCDSSPRITRTEPRDITISSKTVSTASDITLYFNCALDPGTVQFAANKNADGIWISAKDEDTKSGKDWFYDPVYSVVGGFYTVHMNIRATTPPGNSLITVNIKGVKNTLNEEMAEYSFSWNTSRAVDASLTSYKATYNSGNIEILYNRTGAEEGRVRLNGLADIPVNNEKKLPDTVPPGKYEYGITVSGLSDLDNFGVREGRHGGIEVYEVFIELYVNGVMENRTTLKIWNFPGMEVRNDYPVKEIRTEAELAAMNNDLGGQYMLADDITVSVAWTPVGSNGNPFIGKLYGNGHTVTISGFAANPAADTGLFGVVSGGLVRDLTVAYGKNVDVNSAANVGGIAGQIQNETRILNCVVKGASGIEILSLTQSGGNEANLGGIAG